MECKETAFGEYVCSKNGKIAELEAIIEYLDKRPIQKIKADAIRDMLKIIDIGCDSMYHELEVIDVTHIVKYIDTLEMKSD